LREVDGLGSPFVNSIALIIIAAMVTAVATWFWGTRTAAIIRAKEVEVAHQALLVRTAALEEQLRRINDVVSPIYGVMQSLLVKELTHDHAPEMDELMRLLELEPPDLTKEADARLHKLLLQRSTDKTIPQHERDSAMMLPVILKRARLEAEQRKEADRVLHEKDVVLVSVPNAVPPVP
jgi:hypothetical protein